MQDSCRLQFETMDAQGDALKEMLNVLLFLRRRLTRASVAQIVVTCAT
jgi:hypothetical protein